MQQIINERDKKRWLRRLAVAADPGQPERLRVAAIRSIKACLSDINPLKRTADRVLLNSVKQPWETRVYLRNGRGVELMVSSPPESLSDLW